MSDLFGGPPEEPPDEPQYDAFGYPLDYQEVEDPYGFEIRSGWYDSVTIDNPEGIEFTRTSQQWHEIVMGRTDAVYFAYDMYPVDIMYELEYLGYVDAEDWRIWREYYDEMYG